MTFKEMIKSPVQNSQISVMKRICMAKNLSFAKLNSYRWLGKFDEKQTKMFSCNFTLIFNQFLQARGPE